MTSLKLDYQQEIQRTFYKISPVSSRTSKHQTTPKPFPHFSIVIYIDDSNNNQKQFQEAIDIIKSVPTHRFCETLNLHSTLLSTEGKINSNNVKSLYDATKEFFAGINIEQQLKIDFSLIHPGKWDNNNHLTESDGTVIALAKKEGNNNSYFLDITNKLKDHINNALNLSLEHKYPNTIWCTLGFFNEEDDFPIDPCIFAAFNNPKLRKFNHTITVNEISITEFRLKSLKDGVKRYVIRL
jgi:hypothetical protein